MNPNNEHDRVRRNTSPKVLDRLDKNVSDSVRFYATQPAEAIRQRIHKLEQEWDVERVLETNASTLALVGVVLAATVDRRWLLLSAGVLGFLFMHGVQGWCPPLPLLRRLGVRTQTEIDREKFALKVLRGDLDHVISDPRRQARPDSIREAVEV